MTALPSHVQELADRVAAGHGVEVLELGLRGQGRGRVLSVVLDAEEPVEADVVEEVSKDLSRALDEADPVAGSYILEVSTPGLSRPLHTRRDFRRQRGHEVAIVRRGGPAADGDEAATPVRGVVVDADDEADPVAGSYTLEVSTPGLSRPLHTRRDFRRQRGHEVAVVRRGGPAADGDEDGTSVRGVVVDADDEAVVLEVEGSQVRVPLSEVVRGKVVLPW